MSRSPLSPEISAELAFEAYLGSKKVPGSVRMVRSPYPTERVQSHANDADKELFLSTILENLKGAQCYDTSFRAALTVFAEVACEHPFYLLELPPLIEYVKLANDVHDHFRRTNHPRRYAAWQRFVTAQFLSLNFHLIAAQTEPSVSRIEVSDLEILEQRGLFRSSQDPRWVGLPMQVHAESNYSRSMSCGDLFSINKMVETKLRLNHSDNEFIWKVIVTQCIEEISDFTIKCNVSVTEHATARQILIELLDRGTATRLGMIGFTFLPQNGEFRVMEAQDLASLTDRTIERTIHADGRNSTSSGKVSASRLPLGW